MGFSLDPTLDGFKSSSNLSLYSLPCLNVSNRIVPSSREWNHPLINPIFYPQSANQIKAIHCFQIPWTVGFGPLLPMVISMLSLPTN
jgi:hypothetical protein